MNLTNPNAIEKVNKVIKEKAQESYNKVTGESLEIDDTILVDWFIADQKREAYQEAVKDILTCIQRNGASSILESSVNGGGPTSSFSTFTKRNSLKYFESVIDLNNDQEPEDEVILSLYNKLKEQSNAKQESEQKL